MFHLGQFLRSGEETVVRERPLPLLRPAGLLERIVLRLLSQRLVLRWHSVFLPFLLISRSHTDEHVPSVRPSPSPSPSPARPPLVQVRTATSASRACRRRGAIPGRI